MDISSHRLQDASLTLSSESNFDSLRQVSRDHSHSIRTSKLASLRSILPFSQQRAQGTGTLRDVSNQISLSDSVTALKTLFDQRDSCNILPESLTEELYLAWAGVESILDYLEAPAMTDANAIDRAKLLIEQLHIAIERTLNNSTHVDPSRQGMDQCPLLNTVDKLVENSVNWSILLDTKIVSMFANAPRLPLVSKSPSIDEATLLDHVVFDQKPGKISSEFKGIEVYFRGLHQISEVGFWVQRQLLKFYNSADLLEDKCTSLHCMARMADRLSESIMCLKHLNITDYARYRPAISGTSGAGSRQLKFLQSQLEPISREFYDTCKAVLGGSQDQDRKNQAKLILAQPDQYKDLYIHLQALHDFETAYVNFWAQHAILAATTLGIGSKGTQDMEVSSLFRRVEYMLKKSPLLQAVSEFGIECVDQSERLFEHNVDGRRVGHAVAERLNKVEHALIQSQSWSEKSYYHRWFESDAVPDLNEYLHFETFGMGLPVVFALRVVEQTEALRHANGNQSWQHYFTNSVPHFQSTLKNVLGLSDSQYQVTEGANTTEFLFRLMSALPGDNPHIKTTNREFLAADRVFRSCPDQVDFIPVPSREDYLKQVLSGLEQQPDLMFISQVYSNFQWTLSERELRSIVDACQSKTQLVIDITQGLCNLPTSWGKVLQEKPNVFLLGSCIKHARAGEGVGFLVHHPDNQLAMPAASGWTANLAGLSTGQNLTPKGQLAFDPGGQWRGGTPANHAHLELFSQTWDAVFASGETLQSLHGYVQKLTRSFLAGLTEHDVSVISAAQLLNTDQMIRAPDAFSNTLVFKTDKAQQLQEYLAALDIYCDAKTIDGEQYLRLGFGIEHGQAQVNKLIQALSQF